MKAEELCCHVLGLEARRAVSLIIQCGFGLEIVRFGDEGYLIPDKISPKIILLEIDKNGLVVSAEVSQ